MQMKIKEETEMVTSEMVKVLDQLLQFKSQTDSTFNDLQELLQKDFN